MVHNENDYEEDSDLDLDLNDDQTDYKSLYETEKSKREKAEINFKARSKELNEIKKSQNTNQPTLDKDSISKQVAEEMYYNQNTLAKEFRSEISAIQAKTGMSPEDATTFYLAQNKPELLIQKSNSGVDGVEQQPESKKAFSDMTYEELRSPKAGG